MKTRRDFLASGIGAVLGAAMASDALAREKVSKGASDVGQEGPLQIEKLEIRVGAAKPFRALRFSDTHLTFMDVKDMLDAEDPMFASTRLEKRKARFPLSQASLVATLAYARKQGLPLLNTGDLFDFRSDANIACARRALEGLNVFSSLGNHEGFGEPLKARNPKTADEGRALRSVYEQALGNSLLVDSRVIGGVKFIAFDNGGLHRWDLKKRRKRLEGALSCDEPVVLMCHRPFGSTAVRDLALNRGGQKAKTPKKMTPWMMTEDDSADIFRIVRAHRSNVKAILCGHIHLERSWAGEWEGIPMFVGQANCFGGVQEITFA